MGEGRNQWLRPIWLGHDLTSADRVASQHVDLDMFSTDWCVAASSTLGAWPASSASTQRGASRHQWSPGLSPGNAYSGIGVERSLPRDFEKARNAAVASMHTV